MKVRPRPYPCFTCTFGSRKIVDLFKFAQAPSFLPNFSVLKGMLVYTFPSCSQDIVFGLVDEGNAIPSQIFFCANWYSRSPWTCSLDVCIGVDLVDLRDVKIVKKLGGTVDDTELVKGLVFDKKAKILVVKDVERDAIEFITKTLNCLPIANIEHFREEKMGRLDCVEEVSLGDGEDCEDYRSCMGWKVIVSCGHFLEEALEVIPYTLAENAGLNPIAIVDRARTDMQWVRSIIWDQCEERADYKYLGGKCGSPRCL
ncbi:hypothetical protein IFM89_009705 [Coptis chinensis]|uniref:Uncharacterized protein n=1 Tax=Coptis chinensis TaxID=261450 RepID=A0A835HWW7_9MAGN|nr:hypothetical protein IFM89_009705 [Coptis chinensis]